MQEEIHRAALGAAARIAFSVTLLGGCSGAQATDPTTPEGEAAGEADEHTDYAESAAKKPPAAKKPVVSVPQRSAACCESIVSAAMPDSGVVDHTAPVSADVKACCKVLAEANDAKIKDGKGGWDWQQRSYCCSALGWSGSVTCTPWGPPVPPAFLPREVA